jgi:hypothetical protein
MSKISPNVQLKRINKRLEQLRSGLDVQLRDMRTALGDELYKAMEAEWAEQIDLRKQEKPEAIKRYEEMLSRGLMLEGRYEQISTREKALTRKDSSRALKVTAFGINATSILEDALEYLHDSLDQDPSLHIWLDRAAERDSGDADVYPEKMPRVITSTSMENCSSAKKVFGLKSRRQIKIDALESAALELGEKFKSSEQKQHDEGIQNKLIGMLKARLSSSTDC